MWHLKNRGFIFDKNTAGANPAEEFKWLLCAELTSVNNFNHCLETESASALHNVALACREITDTNIRLISERLEALGEEVPQSPDLWHSFIESMVEVVHAGAQLLGDEVIVTTLRKHELALFGEYELRVGKLGGDDLVLLQKYLLPNQLQVCELLGAIKSDEADALLCADPLNLNFA
jgi:hypothetical protein